MPPERVKCKSAQNVYPSPPLVVARSRGNPSLAFATASKKASDHGVSPLPASPHTCRRLSTFPDLGDDFSELAPPCSSMLEHPGTCRNMQEHAGICGNMQEYACFISNSKRAVIRNMHLNPSTGPPPPPATRYPLPAARATSIPQARATALDRKLPVSGRNQ